MTDKKISIVISVAESDATILELLSSLIEISEKNLFHEIICVTPAREKLLSLLRLSHFYQHLYKIKITESASASRAYQLNLGGKNATGEILFFLHADSKIQEKHFIEIDQIMQSDQKKLYFFPVSFNEGSFLMKLNSLYVNYFRTFFFNLPLGDQGFIIDKKLWFDFYGFPENCSYGEDHVLVWQMKLAGLKIESLATPIGKSSRKYQRTGWLSSTLNSIHLAIKQGWPFYKKYIFYRYGPRI